jgi:hypothetical protein
LETKSGNDDAAVSGTSIFLGNVMHCDVGNGIDYGVGSESDCGVGSGI